MMAAGRLPWESDDEVLLLYAVGNKRKRKWVHVVNMKRREFGEFHHLYCKKSSTTYYIYMAYPNLKTL